MVQPKQKWTARRIILGAAVFVVIVLGLSLGLGLGLKKHHDDSSLSNSWNDASQFLLSKSFNITREPTTRYYDWTLSQQTIAPDGLERPMLLVNGMFPGPLIEANTGDRIVVKVTNNMVNGTAIHWHGMFQNGTNWMDGTMAITQCAIPPGQSFTYNYTVPNQWGTYWWHAHAQSQYVDGVFGPLVIHSPDEPHLDEYDEDIIMMLSDYYHTDSGSLVAWYMTTESEGVEPVPDNGLINGRNTWDCSLDSQAMFPTGNKCTPGAPMSVFDFKSNTTYRIRVINSGAFADFTFSIDSHNLTLIEADGVDMQPVVIQRFPIHVAQRYSVIVHANQTVDNYWVRATMNTNCFNVDNAALNPNTFAIVRYEGAPITENVTSIDWSESAWNHICVDLTEDMLKPYYSEPAPAADTHVYITSSFQTIEADQINRGYMNSTSWVPLANDATVFQAQRGISKFDATQQIITLNSTGVVEVLINNYDEGSHPFHFHGHMFYVLGWGDGNYVPGKSVINTENPLRRDTSTIPSYGWTLIRFVNDNPGMWAFHCHIEWHMEAGLMVQFESLPDQIKNLQIPSEMTAMCGASK
ncbi:hypothetical protein BGZ79_000893 [Entomortierella chlamydospora]|nr:hypothetical protein BGZ79_000893 [Entomortierella chlamydospora]